LKAESLSTGVSSHRSVSETMEEYGEDV